MTLNQNKKIAQGAFEALMSGDLSPLPGLLAPNALVHQCGFLDPIPPHALLSGESPRRRLLTDRQVQLEHMVGEGNLVALHWRTTGRHSDPEESELDGKEVSFPSITFIRFQSGKIAEIWYIPDTATLQTQLHAPAELAGRR